MNYIDLLIISVCIFGFVKGYSNGLVKEITGALSLVISFYVAINFYSIFEPFFNNYFKNENIKSLLVFSLLFLFSLLFIRIVGYIVDKITRIMALGIASRLLGSLFGFFKLYLICGLILFFEKPISIINKNLKQNSVLYQDCHDFILKAAPSFNHKKIRKNIEKKREEFEKKFNLKTPQ